MATNFPSSADSFTNPTSGDTLDNPPHDQQHANINDAMEAVQASLLDGSPLKIDDANNRVGIGTTSPAKKLHVKGDDEGIRIEDGDATDHYDIYRNDTTGHLEFTGSQTSFSGYDFEVNNGTNVMRIANSGNVGIGTTSPAEELDVVGDVQVSGRLGIGSGISAELDIKGASNPEIRLQSTDSSDPFIYFGDQVDAVRGGIGFDTSANALLLRGYNNSTRMTIDSSGNVGVGTTSPTASLTVTSATDDAKVKIDSNGGSVGIVDATANSNDATGRWLAINPSGGYVGINDSSPSYQLDVNGDINAQGYARSKGKKLGMALLHNGSLGGGVSTFLNQFNADWKNYRIVIDAAQNGNTTWTYFRFVDSSNTAISSGYYTAYFLDGTFGRQNGQTAAVAIRSGYHAYGGMVMDITLPYTGDNPSFHISSAGHDPSNTNVDSLWVHGYCVTSLDITGIQFYNGSPYGSVKVYGY